MRSAYTKNLIMPFPPTPVTLSYFQASPRHRVLEYPQFMLFL